MNRFKIVSIVLAVLFGGYAVGSASVIRQTRGKLVEAESRCSELKLRCSELESKRASLPEPVVATTTAIAPQPVSTDGTIDHLQEMLGLRETQLAELSERYDSLQAAYDALQERVEQMPDLPPEALERMQRMRDRMGTSEMSAEERDLRRQEFVQGALDRVQERMVQMSDDATIQQNLTLISDNIAAMADLRQQFREAVDEETRQEIGVLLREQESNLRSFVRDERDLELAYVAKRYGVTDTEGFVQAVNNLGGEFAFGPGFAGRPGGRGFRDR
jgi:DNA repair exonuclease SbcCD ATPase subunit